MNLESVKQLIDQNMAKLVEWISSAEFYSQLGLVILAITLSYSLTILLRRHAHIFKEPPQKGALQIVRRGIYNLKDILFPLISIFFLALTIDLSHYLLKQSGLVRFVEVLAVILMIYSVITLYVENLFIKTVLKWVLIPIAILQIVGWLDHVVNYFESISIQIGNIKLTAFGIIRVLFIGAFLFWLGRISNRVGQQIIRQQAHLDAGTKEVAAKVYQVTLIVIVFILLLQVMGVNITTLAVFGGALGVGLGFGLQSIASNFISGMILLMDRSLTVGDYIELADGRKGIIRELNMRSTTLETFDGKDIMVPNDQFITTSFINWTHKNTKQRYAIEFQVAYSTDLHKLFDILREVVSSHPKVLSGPDIPIEERADAEISAFEDSGVKILIEFWMEGIDDGVNRVGGDLYLMIWDALKENNITIPFPQREVKLVRVGEEAVNV